MLYRLSYVSVLRAIFRFAKTPIRCVERVAGIEPASSAWKAEVLPLNYTRSTRLEFEADPLPGGCTALLSIHLLRNLLRNLLLSVCRSCAVVFAAFGGGGRIRTFEG